MFDKLKKSKKVKKPKEPLPPVKLWDETPNWRSALDEEGRAGQDETTLKPCRGQTTIHQDVSATAGDVWLPDDRVLPALLDISDQELIASRYRLPSKSSSQTPLPRRTGTMGIHS